MPPLVLLVLFVGLGCRALLLTVRVDGSTAAVTRNVVDAAFDVGAFDGESAVRYSPRNTSALVTLVADESVELTLVRTVGVASSSAPLESFDAPRRSSTLAFASSTSSSADITTTLLRVNLSAALPLALSVRYNCSDTFLLLERWSLVARALSGGADGERGFSVSRVVLLRCAGCCLLLLL